MPSFSTSLSGLDADSQALSVISNNLANLNTTGYKGQTAVFQDLFYQQLGTDGAGNPVQVGVGTQVGSITSQFTQGNIDSTGVPTDAAIQGDGFFVVQNQGVTEYTRAGNFSLDSNGKLVTSGGAQVLGYPAVNGVIDTNQALGSLSIPTGQVSPANPTGNLTLTMNLNGNAAKNDSFSTSATVYDSLGASHLITFTFTNTGPGAWDYTVTIPAADVGQTGAPVKLTNGTGSLKFDGTGKLTTPATDVTGLTMTGLANGATAPTFTWHLFDATGAANITQAAGASAVSQTTQDGYAAGTVSSFIIDNAGIIQGTLSNGQTRALGQIALATFPNEQGLQRNGDNTLLASLAAGTPNIGVAGAGGRGSISGGALERSNVDIASEFAKLIQAERAYQANARAITTADEVTQAAIALKTA